MQTPFYDQHISGGAKIVDFHGWEMPLQYSGIIDEHKNLDSSKFKTVYGDEGYSPFMYKHSNIPYYNFRTGKKEIMEL